MCAAQCIFYSQNQQILESIHYLKIHIKRRHGALGTGSVHPWKKTLKQTPNDLGLTAKDVSNHYASDNSSCLYRPNKPSLNFLPQHGER
jgi:hypothetical protein